MKKYTLLAVGELLVDILGTHLSTSLLDTTDFQRFQGGSPANLASNMARLGGSVALISCIGDDNFGVFVKNEIAKTGLDTSHIVTDPLLPTSIVVVSRTQSTPDFIAYRSADKMLYPAHIPDELLKESDIFHTTSWPLSMEPAQSTVLDAARRATAFGTKLSVDFNYTPSIWPDRENAWKVISEYCSHGAFIKLSEDDAQRLYDRMDVGYNDIITDFHKKGAELVCLTLGADGCIVSGKKGTERVVLAGRKIEVVDATGAGDAFWSGFLTALLDGKDLQTCANAGANIAEKKLTTIGALPAGLGKAELYEIKG